jgi:UPF0755 protein
MTSTNGHGPPHGARSDDGDELEVPAWVGAEHEPVPDARPAGEAASEPPRATPRSSGRRGARRAGTSRQEASGVGDDGYEPFLDFDGYDDRDYVRLPRRPGLMRRVVLSFGVVVVIALVAVAGAGFWLLRQVDPPGPPGDAVAVDIPEGSNTGDIAKLLDRAGVIGSDLIFKEYVRFKGEGSGGDFQAGTYTFNRHSSMAEALAALQKGPIPPSYAEVTFPEGLRVSDIAAKLAQGVNWFTPEEVEAAFTSVRSPYQPADVATLEGLVFPDTYRVEEGETAQQSVTAMVDEFDAVAKEVHLDEGAARLGYTPYQVVVFASMIEREARVPEDRAKIARVIYNRLASDMRLDIDATTLYAVGRGSGTLTQSDLEVDSPYNTRLHKGLPPTPIAAPGRASLEAALNPAEGDWLFYVLSDADGHHVFTDNISDFNDAVAEAEAKGLLG